MLSLQRLVFALSLYSVGFFIPAAAGQSGPVVDLGYARYKGTSDPATGYDNYFGMRFAAPPVGNLRFRAPRPPVSTPRNVVFDASSNSLPGTVCPQGLVPGTGMTVEAQMAIPSSEDCLTLTVYAPTGGPKGRSSEYKSGFPVVVYIHGGGYTMGDHSYDHPQRWLDLADKDVVVVVPNYRLGLFGFLAGDDVNADGDLNAGLLDQQFALQWVQDNIDLFGGDKSKVTIWGQSAGGGSVINHIVSNPDYPGNKGLFTNAVANSPFLPSQLPYNHNIPKDLYNNLLTKTGCKYGKNRGLPCLRKLSTETLARANLEIAAASYYGTLTWQPVIEPSGGYLDMRPTVALDSSRSLKAQRVLTTHTAWEGQSLANPTITTANLTSFVQGFKPTLSTSQVSKLISLYPLTDYISEFQRSQSIYQDTVFLCPSYWLASAFAGAAYKGIWNLAPGGHGQDATYWFSPTDYHTLPSPETFENYVGGIVSFVRSGDANRYRLNKGKGESNELRWPWFEDSRRSGLVFSLAEDQVSSDVALKGQDAKLKARCEWWRSVGDVVGQ